MGRIKEFFIRREITKLVREQGIFTGVIAWFNAAPGRKRGAAALLFALSAFLKYMGNAAWADHAERAVQVIEAIEPGVDIVGLVMLAIGFRQPVKRATAAFPVPPPGAGEGKG